MRENKSNKVTNLEILKKNKKNFIVPNFFFLSYRNWKKEKKNISNYIQLKMKAECSLVAVRSAFSEEDGKKSFAGAFSTLEPTPTISSVDDGEVDSAAGGNQTIVVTGTNRNNYE